MWFFNIGLYGKDGMVDNRQMRTLETMLKDNKHTEVRGSDKEHSIFI